MAKKITFLILLLSCFLISCTGTRLKLHDWQKLPKEQYTIPPYAKYLQNYKIALDPGHGGLAQLPGYKRGPTGKREAVMNLNVALFLKEFLEKAGAKVVLTRTGDYFVSLQDRVDMAENEKSAFLVSLHHNADANPDTNYVSVYYHLHPDFSPMSMDLARNVYFELVQALRLPDVAEDGLLTDRLIYPAGFGLLRRSTIPAILLETSFFTNPKEEKRLMDLRYNRREAYAIFLGLARWAAGGQPEAKLLEPAGISRNKRPEIVYRPSDGIAERGGRSDGRLLVYSESASLKIDGKTVPVAIDLRRKEMRFQPDSALANGPHFLQVNLQNLFKNHNFPRTDTLIIAAPVDSITFSAPTYRLPADGAALLPVTFSLFDRDGEPAWDGTKVQLSTDRGSISPSETTLQNSTGIAYYKSATGTGSAHIVAVADGHRDTLAIELILPGESWVLSGMVVDDSTSTGIPNAKIAIDDSVWAETNRDGGFFVLNPPAGQKALLVSRDGYAGESRTIEIDSMRSAIVLSKLPANLGGLLHDETIVIDAALGGEKNGEIFSDGESAADANLNLALALADTLRWAGVQAVLVRRDRTNIAVDDRIGFVNSIPDGWYLKLRYKKIDTDSILVQTTGYPGNMTGEEIAQAIKHSFAQLPNSRVVNLLGTNVREVTRTNKTALEVVIGCRKPEIATRDMPALFRGIVMQKMAERRKATGVGIDEN
jgi:N-acetylmuramoyl-L-alanine amidase